MKILEISYFDPNGNDRAGVERYINKLKELFESNGNQVTLVSITFNKYKKAMGIQIYVNPLLRRLGLAKIIYNIKLFYYLSNNNNLYDIVHINGDNGVFIPYISGCKTIMTLHGSMTETVLLKKRASKIKFNLSYILDRIDGYLEVNACKKSNAVIAVSSHLRDYFSKYANRSDILVVHTCIDPPEEAIRGHKFNLHEILNSKKLICLWVGRDPIRKGLKTAKDAVSGLSDVTLITVGFTDPEQNSNVINLGFVEDETLNDIYYSSNVFLFPSSAEGFSAAALEAMSYGLVPVVSDIPPFREVIDDCKNGFLVKSENGYKERLKWLLNNMEIMNQLRLEAMKTARRFYCSSLLPIVYNKFKEIAYQKT